VPERPVIVFDVNETLLDLDAIQPSSTGSSAISRPCACGSPT
jgi:hypothetical protein